MILYTPWVGHKFYNPILGAVHLASVGTEFPPALPFVSIARWWIAGERVVDRPVARDVGDGIIRVVWSFSRPIVAASKSDVGRIHGHFAGIVVGKPWTESDYLCATNARVEVGGLRRNLWIVRPISRVSKSNTQQAKDGFMIANRPIWVKRGVVEELAQCKFKTFYTVFPDTVVCGNSSDYMHWTGFEWKPCDDYIPAPKPAATEEMVSESLAAITSLISQLKPKKG